jgi:hypothetical protein
MSVLTPGYILEISETTLLINGHSMPFSGVVEDGVDALLEQLSQLTQSGGAPGGLGIVIKDSRPGGLGEVSRTIPSGSAVTLDMFAPAVPVVHNRPEAARTAEAEELAPSRPPQAFEAPVVSTPAVVAPASVQAALPEPEPAADDLREISLPVAPTRAEPTPAMSPFARLAQAAPAQAAAAPAMPVATSVAPAQQRRLEAPQQGMAAPRVNDAPVPAPGTPDSQSRAVQQSPAPVDQGAASPEVADVVVKGLEPAADEIDFQSIFKDDDPIIDEGIRTPIGRAITSRQRKEGFSLKSNARIEVERRRERKRKVIYGTVAAITLVAALRIVGAVMAGPSGDYAAICVDARTMERQPNAVCSTNSNPFVQTVYFGVGQTVPGVGGKAQGGTPEKPLDPRSVNTEVAEGREGVVLDGGEVK